MLALAPRITLAQTDPTPERPREGDVLVAVGATAPEALKPREFAAQRQATFGWPVSMFVTIRGAAAVRHAKVASAPRRKPALRSGQLPQQ